ncbi:MAG: Zn-dependent metalloprotease [Ancylomarina sp.]|jgi:Zn-dependent metalloprotease
MRNLLYIVACILISIIVGLLSPLISPELFNLVKSNDNNELEYVEIIELKPDEKAEKIEKPEVKNEKVSLKTKTVTKEIEDDDNYVEELPPETLFRINRYGKWEFWNYYRDASRIKFSKKMRNLYEETYSIKNKKDPKFKYSIHVFASKKTTLISQLKLKGLYENFDQDENLYRYFYRSFDNYWVCRRELREVRSSGFPDAYIVKL